MESVQGSWQYEVISSANETSYASSPSSPAMYGQVPDLKMWDEYSMDLQDPLIGCGEQLLSGNSIIGALSPPRAAPVKLEVEDMYVDPNLVQPQPLSVGDPAPIDLADLEEFLGESLDFTTIVSSSDQTEAQEYVDLQPEPLDEASVNLGSPISAELEPTINFGDLMTIDSGDIVAESDLVAVLGNGEAINFDQWLVMEQDEEVQDESFETSYDDDSTMNEDSYLDSSSQMSSVLSSDAEDETQEQTINALMRSDLSAAQAAIINSNFTTPAVATYIVNQPRSGRRGRKPSSTPTLEKTWRNVKDKGLRKKQHNKLAATKYRMKKKEEAQVSMVEENKLQDVCNKLTQEQQRLADKIRQVKELLKEKYRL